MRKGRRLKDGRVEGHALIFSSENSRTATAEQPLTGECWTLPTKDPTSKGKGEASTRVGGEKSHLESNPMISRDAQRAQTKLCACQDPGTPWDWARPAFECLSVSCGGMGQQRPAAGTGTLAAADLGSKACEPHHRATRQTNPKLEQ